MIYDKGKNVKNDRVIKHHEDVWFENDYTSYTNGRIPNKKKVREDNVVHEKLPNSSKKGENNVISM